MALFWNREEAGRRLASQLLAYRNESPLVLGLPRGGVPVAAEIARALGAPLDVWIARKVGAPSEPELGIGAVTEGGEVLVDEAAVAYVGATREEIDAIVARETAEVEDRKRRLRRGRPPPEIAGKTVVLVDDGIATGGTARAALRAIRARGPARLVLATPVGAEDTLRSLADEADEIVCLAPLSELRAIGLWYEDFEQVTDDEVIALVEEARASESAPASNGELVVPWGAEAVIVFAHGSGSSRKSPRNRFVAQELRRAGLGTLLFDLLTPEEEREDAVDAHLRFDVDLLARRLVAATDWVRSQPNARDLRIGYFGGSTGAAAALIAAAARPNVIGAIVSRGGRPDLAEHVFGAVRAPVLFIVGGNDPEVLQINRESLEQIDAPKSLAIVRGATHLFEEPGALDEVAELAIGWFVRHLVVSRSEARV